MELMTIEADKFGISKTRAEQLEGIFLPMFETLKQFDSEYESITQLANKEITKESCNDARNLRLKIAKVRIATEKARKTEKEEIVKAGKAIDGIANMVKYAVSEQETKLKEIETHFETLEKERIDNLAIEREQELSQYEIESMPPSLGEMSQDVYDIYLSGVKTNHEAIIVAREKAKAEEAARLKAEEEERQRVIEENKRLKDEAEEKARLQKIEDEKRIAEQKRIDEERRVEQAKIEAEREKERKIAAEKQAKIEAELQKQRKEAEKKEQERVKAEKESEAEKQRIIDTENAKKERLAKAGDAEKLHAFRKELIALSLPELSNKETQEQLRSLLNQIASICK